jgi:hypothetical protein
MLTTKQTWVAFTQQMTFMTEMFKNFFHHSEGQAKIQDHFLKITKCSKRKKKTPQEKNNSFYLLL